VPETRYPEFARIQTPIGGVGVPEPIRDGLLDIPVGIKALRKRIPRHVVRSRVHDQQIVEFALEIQLLDEYFRNAAAAVLVGKDSRRARRRSRSITLLRGLACAFSVLPRNDGQKRLCSLYLGEYSEFGGG
jgi:hypothetical protein